VVPLLGTSLRIAGHMSKNGIRQGFIVSKGLQTVPGGIEIAIELQHFIPDILEMSPIGAFQGDGIQIQMMIMRGFH
jgi:hypothetical protein